jgi:hypothetical protein
VLPGFNEKVMETLYPVQRNYENGTPHCRNSAAVVLPYRLKRLQPGAFTKTGRICSLHSKERKCNLHLACLYHCLSTKSIAHRIQFYINPPYIYESIYVEIVPSPELSRKTIGKHRIRTQMQVSSKQLLVFYWAFLTFKPDEVM